MEHIRNVARPGSDKTDERIGGLAISRSLGDEIAVRPNDKGVLWKPDCFIVDMMTGETKVAAYLNGCRPTVPKR